MACSRRELLLRVHAHRLRREDLEDCFSQATLELIVSARRRRFASSVHLARTLEQRFVSRVQDRRRALSGRSPMQAAIERGRPLDVGTDRDVLALADLRAEPERVALLREELWRIRALADRLSPEQRLVIATQVALEMRAGEFCALHAWSQERYRKTAQRGRARLRGLMLAQEPLAQEPVAAREPVPTASARSEQTAGTGL